MRVIRQKMFLRMKPVTKDARAAMSIIMATLVFSTTIFIHWVWKSKQCRWFVFASPPALFLDIFREAESLRRPLLLSGAKRIRICRWSVMNSIRFMTVPSWWLRQTLIFGSLSRQFSIISLRLSMISVFMIAECFFRRPWQYQQNAWNRTEWLSEKNCQ